MATKIQFRRGTELEWTTADPVLSIGEVGFETDSARFKIGDGSSNWSELSYFFSDDFIATSASAYALSQANSYTDAEISALIDTAPGALDTLNELAAALGDDSNFSTTITNSLAEKLSIISASSTYLTQSSASTIYATKESPALTGTATAVNLTTSGTLSSNGPLILATGASATLPLKLQSGVVTSALNNGGIEYDGTTITAIQNDKFGRAPIDTTIFTSGIGTSGIAATTNYPLFPAANDVITLPVGTYRYQTSIRMQVTGSTVSLAFNLNMRGNGSATGSLSWDGTASILDASAASAFYVQNTSASANIVVSAASAVATRQYLVRGSGILKITTQGTIQPSYQWTVTNTGGTVTLYADNYMTLTPLSTSATTASTGGWA
jgi:hypothetical protein